MPTTTPHLPTLYTIASGKGGVGKTSFTLNLATLLAKQGKKVLVMDGDTGLANIDVQLNLQPKADLAHVLTGQKTLAEVAMPTPQGFFLIAGRAGNAGLANISTTRMESLLTDLAALSKSYDITLIDAAAGITSPTLAMCAAAIQTLLVVTPDPSSLTDAYALIKILWQTHGVANCTLVANQANAAESKEIQTKLSTAMQSFLQLPPLPLATAIPADKSYAQAVRMHTLATTAFPSCPAVNAIHALANQLAGATQHQKASA